jgi:hypothetical protein
VDTKAFWRWKMMKGWRLIALSFLGLVLVLASGSAFTLALSDEDSGSTLMRWDIVAIDFKALTVSSGGHASARANEGSRITLTGSGTFLATEDGSRFTAIAKSGGGTWQSFDMNGAPTGNGTYRVMKGPAVWRNAPGSPNTALADLIGEIDDQRGGLFVVEISFDDGSRGSLVVSCHLPGAGQPTTPDTVFEGITVTKGFVDYWNREAPVPGVDADRTLFHVLRQSD